MNRKFFRNGDNTNKEENLNIIEESFNGLNKFRPLSNNEGEKNKNNNSSQNTNNRGN